jgi:hypothetical protein
MGPQTGCVLVILLSLSLTLSVSGKNILFFSGLASQSHLATIEPLAEKLAELGHKVTIQTTVIPPKPHPRITFYCPKSVLNLIKFMTNDVGRQALLHRIQSQYNDFTFNHSIWDSLVGIMGMFYGDPEFLKWVESSKFDLVVSDGFGREISLPLANKWKAKNIIFNPSTILYYEFDALGLPSEASFGTSMETERAISDTFLQGYRQVTWNFWRLWLHLPKYDRIISQVFPGTPSISVLEKMADIYFLNMHFSYEHSQSLPAFVVPVGGMHCRNSTGIPDKVRTSSPKNILLIVLRTPRCKYLYLFL